MIIVEEQQDTKGQLVCGRFVTSGMSNVSFVFPNHPSHSETESSYCSGKRFITTFTPADTDQKDTGVRD